VKACLAGRGGPDSARMNAARASAAAALPAPAAALPAPAAAPAPAAPASGGGGAAAAATAELASREPCGAFADAAGAGTGGAAAAGGAGGAAGAARGASALAARFPVGAPPPAAPLLPPPLRLAGSDLAALMSTSNALRPGPRHGCSIPRASVRLSRGPAASHPCSRAFWGRWRGARQQSEVAPRESPPFHPDRAKP
jgi:hypothetical protein